MINLPISTGNEIQIEIIIVLLTLDYLHDCDSRPLDQSTRITKNCFARIRKKPLDYSKLCRFFKIQGREPKKNVNNIPGNRKNDKKQMLKTLSGTACF